MSLQRARTRPLWATVIALLVFAVLVPSLPAAAAEEPPFEIRFPQEIEVTVFTSSFGDGRSGGRRHHGVDLMAPKMTQVYAATDGYVSRIETHSLAGRYIEIIHVAGWATRYVHLNNDNLGTDDGDADWSLTLAPGVFIGAWVVAGQLIAWAGDSGNAEWTGSHTHFELVTDGRPIDPYPYLKEAWDLERARNQANLWDLIHSLDLYRIS